MQRQTAGIILRHENKIFYINPTGSDGWGIPKGGVEQGEDIKQAAIREFEEETGLTIDHPDRLVYLQGSGDVKQGKKINAFIYEGDGTEKYISSNIIADGYRKGLPENQDGRYFDIEEAAKVVHKNQISLLELYVDSL
jgi:8-oxo-dGTP pyrophosphatase MutT (NUDIX family)